MYVYAFKSEKKSEIIFIHVIKIIHNEYYLELKFQHLLEGTRIYYLPSNIIDFMILG